LEHFRVHGKFIWRFLGVGILEHSNHVEEMRTAIL
jgi:hypothetical protein